MSRYFANLAKRTGLGRQSGLATRSQADRPASMENKGKQIHSAVEVHVSKTVTQPVARPDTIVENRPTRENRPDIQGVAQKNVLVPSESLNQPERKPSRFNVKSDLCQSVEINADKEVGGEGLAESHAKTPGKYVQTHLPQAPKTKQQDRHGKDLTEPAPLTLEVSVAATAVESEVADDARRIAKQPGNADSQHQVAGKQLIDTAEIPLPTKSQSPGRQSFPEEKNMLLHEDKHGSNQHTDGASVARPPQTEVKEPANIPSSLKEGAEKTVHRGTTTTTSLDTQRARNEDLKPEKQATAARDSSVAIHIGTISFEVHQAPQEKTVPAPYTPPAPRPVVIPQSPPSPSPRLSRYYLRGV